VTSADAATTSPSDSVIVTTDGTSVNVRRTYTSSQRRAYVQALEIYREYLRQGIEDRGRPNPADQATIRFYLDHPVGTNRSLQDVQQIPSAPAGYVVPETEAMSDRDLTSEQRSNLLRAVKIGRCPQYKGYPSSFMALCKKLIKGRQTQTTQGFISDVHALKLHRADTARSTTQQLRRDFINSASSSSVAR
jgi:hypothetical protein